MELRWTCLALLLGACGEEPAPAPAEPAAPVAPAAEMSLDLQDLQGQATMDAVVPSPAETQKALANAGLSTRLATLSEGRDLKVDVADNDEVAVRTGVVLAHVVLCAEAAPKERLMGQLKELRTGLGKLGANERILATVDDLTARVGNDASSRADLVREMDELANVMVPEVEYAIGERALPLLRAGAWIEGAWMVTGAIQAEGRYDVATTLLRQPQVVKYFKDYLYGEGKQVAPAAIHGQLEQTLVTIEGAVNKETLGEADVKTIHDATDALLQRLQG